MFDTTMLSNQVILLFPFDGCCLCTDPVCTSLVGRRSVTPWTPTMMVTNVRTWTDCKDYKKLPHSNWYVLHSDRGKVHLVLFPFIKRGISMLEIQSQLMMIKIASQCRARLGDPGFGSRKCSGNVAGRTVSEYQLPAPSLSCLDSFCVCVEVGRATPTLSFSSHIAFRPPLIHTTVPPVPTTPASFPPENFILWIRD